MIRYNWETERWEEDYTFCNFSMTPESDPEMFDKVFDNWDEFYDHLTCEGSE